MNIAVIDSDKSTADFVKRCFNNKKVNVDLYHSAKDFNQKGAAGYQLLVICQELPDTTGLKLNDKIKTIKEFKDLPVIIISASLKNKDLIAHQRGKFGANSYLKKPFSAEKFRDDVVTVLGEEAVGVRKDPTESSQKGNTIPREIADEDEFEEAKGSTLIFDVNDLKNLENINDEHLENTNPNLKKEETTAGFELNFDKTQVAGGGSSIESGNSKQSQAVSETESGSIDATGYDLLGEDNDSKEAGNNNSVIDPAKSADSVTNAIDVGEVPFGLDKISEETRTDEIINASEKAQKDLLNAKDVDTVAELTSVSHTNPLGIGANLGDEIIPDDEEGLTALSITNPMASTTSVKRLAAEDPSTIDYSEAKEAAGKDVGLDDIASETFVKDVPESDDKGSDDFDFASFGLENEDTRLEETIVAEKNEESTGATEMFSGNDEPPTRLEIPDLPSETSVSTDAFGATPESVFGDDASRILTDSPTRAVPPSGFGGSGDESEQMKTLRSYLRLKENELLKATTDLRYTSEELKSMNQQIHNLKEKNAGYFDSNQKLESEVEAYKKELEAVRSRDEGEFDRLRFEMSVKESKLRAADERLKVYDDKYKELRNRVKIDLKKVRHREQELENKLELLKQDSEALITARDKQILELKRKIDTLKFDLDTLTEENEKILTEKEAYREKMSRVERTVRMALKVLDTDLGPVASILNSVSSEINEVTGETERKPA